MAVDDYTIYSVFDLEKHKATSKNYLEVIVTPAGEVKYAIPSHQEFLVSYGARSHNLTRNEYLDQVPKEWYFDFVKWLCNDTSCVAVWSEGYCPCENMTPEQREMLKAFKRNRLMKNQIIM